ncbi:XkdX family protein [Paenibacillus senegalensis]|uniref:XkdX family protein n=1 Tax=Paenibacillus senegalensis TaxID=1465766 RepID=UPI000288EAC1|nr:XkdX family protein [Paenibacillus senegalensis]
MSAWFDRIKRFYDRNLWTLEQVRDGVRTNTITEAEYKEITGQDYDDGSAE